MLKPALVLCSHDVPRCALTNPPTCIPASRQYTLVLLPFQAPGFASASPAGEALLSERITVASVNAPGVVPRSYAPPGYVHPEEGDYNTAAGYLENGNQW